MEVYIHAIGRLQDLRRKAQAIDKERQLSDTPSNLDFGQFGDSTLELGVASGGITEGIEQALD